MGTYAHKLLVITIMATEPQRMSLVPLLDGGFVFAFSFP